MEISLEPESLHFGVKRQEGELAKELRDESGSENGKTLRLTGRRAPPDLWRADTKPEVPGHLTLEIEKLALALKGKLRWKRFTSARFALQMIQGTILVRFLVDAAAKPPDG